MLKLLPYFVAKVSAEANAPLYTLFLRKSTKSHLPDIFFARGHLAQDFPTSCGGLFKTWQSPAAEDLQRTFILWVNPGL